MVEVPVSPGLFVVVVAEALVVLQPILFVVVEEVELVPQKLLVVEETAVVVGEGPVEVQLTLLEALGLQLLVEVGPLVVEQLVQPVAVEVAEMPVEEQQIQPVAVEVAERPVEVMRVLFVGAVEAQLVPFVAVVVVERPAILFFVVGRPVLVQVVVLQLGLFG